jgi:subtilisin family serine protease
MKNTTLSSILRISSLWWAAQAFLAAGILALALGFTSTPVQAQDPSSLSASERSKLDGRFERVVRKARTGKLQSAIRSFRELAQREPARPSRPKARQLEGEELTEQFRPEERPGLLHQKASGQEGRGLLRRLARDVRPDGRRPDGTAFYNAIVEARSPSNLQVRGATVVSAFEGFATVRATPRGLSRLAQSSAVSKVRSPKMAKPQNDVGAAEVGARTLNTGAVGGTEYKGEGTLTCIIDSGIDWSHPDFTDKNGDTRIRAIWDQVDDSTSVPSPAEKDPSRFRQNFNPNFGAEYLRSDIQAALDGSGTINQRDIDGHGTHVAGTAVSSGEAYKRSSGTKRYRGAAPKADIIAVKAGNATFSSFNWLNGVIYCQDVAEAAGKPVVINMSLGGDFAPHDGSDPATQALDQLSRPGAIIVTAAGNSGSPIHTQKSLSSGDSVDVGVDVTQYTPNDGRLNDFYFTSLWTYQPGPYEVSVYTPGGQDTLTVTVDGSRSVRDTSVATPRGAVFLESSTQGNGRYFLVQGFDAIESQPPAEGEWTVRIRHQGGSDTPVHGWFLGSTLGSGEGAGSAAFVQANNLFTINSPATSEGAIAVGNYIQRTRWSIAQQGPPIGIPSFPEGIINPSSSRGPTVDGRLKPAVAAPGTFTASALSDDASASPAFTVGEGRHQMLTGTSMSAPLTSGSVALLLQEDPSLSTDGVRSLLKSTARVDGQVQARGGPPNQTFGAGKLNALRALTSLNGEAAPLEILAYDQPASLDQSASVTLGASGAERAALRFTPTQAGRVAGAYLTLGSNEQEDPANELTDSLRVEVWTDSSGVPGRPIGESVAVAPSELLGFSPNYVNLSATGAAVRPGEDYHIVVASEENGGSVELLAETAGPTAGRSTTFDGSSWSSAGSDLVVRVQVRRDVTAPPAVASLGVGTAEPRNIPLSWEGVGAPDLGAYLIFRDTDPIGSSPNLAPFDSVAAEVTSYTDTTATAGQTYYYRVASVDRSGNRSPASGLSSAFLYPDQVQAQFSRSFGDGGAGSSDYRLLALPGMVDRDAGDLLSGQPGIDWSVLWDDGSQENFLVEYDGSEAFNFRPGRGFWAVSKQDLAVTDSLATVSLQADTATTIPLHEGWNIISNPFGKPVPWALVSAANDGPLQPPFGFEGSFSQRDTLASAETGRAFYFLNDQGLSQLTVPYPGAPQQVGSNEATLATKSASKAVSVTATPVGEREVSSTVRVRSTTGRERPLEVVAPTRRFEAVSLRVRDESAENPRQKFLTTTGRDFSEGQAVPMVLRADTSSVRIRATTEGLDAKSVALISQESGRTYELSEGRAAEVLAGDGSSRFKLVVGSSAFVEEQSQSALPESVRLTTAPNPFRQRTTIRYALPETASVRLEVYDVLGRRVATLVDGRREPGRHRTQFSAQRLSSGVYFGRLKVGETVMTRKLTVVR